MILRNFINQYINQEDVEDIVFHNGSIILKDTIRIIIILGVLFLIFFGLQIYIERPMLKRIFGIIGVFLLMKHAFDVFDKGVDCMILSKNGITFFARDGVWKNKTEFFARDTIETITHQQNTFWDKLFFKGDIKIQLNHAITYDFTEVSNPKKQVKKIMKLKEKNLNQKNLEENNEPNIDKNQIETLSDALSDVIKEYLEKKN